MKLLTEITMSELRGYGRMLNIRGVSNYSKYNMSTRQLLETEIFNRVIMNPERVVFADKPLKYIRNCVRRSGVSMFSDVSESMRYMMVTTLIKSGFIQKDDGLKYELSKVMDVVKEIVTRETKRQLREKEIVDKCESDHEV